MSTAAHPDGSNRRPGRSRSRSAAATVAAALTLTGVLTASAQAQAAPGPLPRETRAALDPALVAGRGADVDFAEQEAENAVTTGTVLGAGKTDVQRRAAYTLTAEASGRNAVSLAPGQYVEFTLTQSANAINVRYSIPDAPTGGGIQSPLDVTVNGSNKKTMTLTSEFSWLYAMYPFSNDPDAGPNPGWWKPEPDPVPKPFRPNHFYDEQRLLLDQKYHKGDKVRLTVPAGATASATTIDLLDYEQVAKPRPIKPNHAVPITQFGADPTGAADSSDAFDAAIAYAKAHRLDVYIPQGKFKITRHIVVDKVTVRGAGNWYSIVFGPVTARATPAADGSTHDAPGFYGKYAEDGGSTKVHLADFAIESAVKERIDIDQVNGIGGAIGGGSVIEGLYIHHTKVGMWFDGPFDGLLVRDNIIVDQLADGINLRKGISNVRATNNFFRNTGDDAMAMWSHYVSGDAAKTLDADRNNVYDHNTVQTPVLANGIAIYGGRDNKVTDNLIADPVREGSALHAGTRFSSTGFAGTLTFARNTTVRAGTLELNWNIGLGAIWLYALEGSLSTPINITDNSFLDVTYNAFTFVADWPVKDLYSITNVHVKNAKIDGAATNIISARAAGSATFENVDARNVGQPFDNNCGSFHFTGTPEFTITRLGTSNDGDWGSAGTWCEDRPATVEPPEPSLWP